MAADLFDVRQGLAIDEEFQILKGATPPGNDDGTNAAGSGSLYLQDTGAVWKKITAGTGEATWSELADKESAIRIEGVASTGVVLDQVRVDAADQFAWEVTAINETDPANKLSVLIHMAHNGTGAADATQLMYSLSSVIRVGAKIPGLGIIGTLSGTGANQTMNLHVSATGTTTFTAYRMVKNLAGSSSVMAGATAVNAHVLDGAVHMTSWQNNLLDNLSASLTAAQVNYLVGVTSGIQDQLDAKQSNAAITIALTGDVTGTVTGVAGANSFSIAAKLAGDVVVPKTFNGAVSVNYTTEGGYVAANCTGATTLSVTGIPSDTKAYGLTFEINNAGTNITWPAGWAWLGTAPTLRASGKSMVTAITRDGGASALMTAA